MHFTRIQSIARDLADCGARLERYHRYRAEATRRDDWRTQSEIEVLDSLCESARKRQADLTAQLLEIAS